MDANKFSIRMNTEEYSIDANEYSIDANEYSIDANEYRIDEYRDLLSKLEHVRRIISIDTDIKLPQFVVIGDQSSGKSSVLSELSGLTFPTKTGICTKCPIIVHTKYNKNLNEFKIEISSNGKSEVTNIHELSQKIIEYQQDNIGSSKVTKIPIKITAESNNLIDLVLIDLPGIIHNGEGKEEVNEMINEYIEPEQSLNIVITEYYKDNETAQALEMVKNHDCDGNRTIRVLTKFDNYDTNESIQRALDMINSTKYNELGAHAVICRPNGKEYCLEAENKVLSKFKIPLERAGISSLRKRLPKLLCNLIETNLPEMKVNISKIINNSNERLNVIGRSDPDINSILSDVQYTLHEQTKNLEIIITKPMKKFQEQIHNTKDIFNEDLINQYYENDCFKCVFFQGEDTFKKCTELMVNDHWKPFLDELLKSIEEIIENILDIRVIQNINSKTKKCLEQCWESNSRKLLKFLTKIINDELEKEKEFKTMNHYLTSKYQEKLILPDDLLREIVESFTLNDFGQTMSNRYSGSKDTTFNPNKIEDIQENIMITIKSKCEEHNEIFNRLPIDEQHKKRVLAAVKANWSVSHKNFIDNALDTVKKFIINIKSWIDQIINNSELKRIASEDDKITSERNHLKQLIDKMEECKKIININ